MNLDVLNSISRLSIMEPNQNSSDNLKEIVNVNEKFISTKNLNKLYPNVLGMTHQMIWFKGCRDRGLRSDIEAKKENKN